MAYNAAQHFTARPDGHGGVTLAPRFRVRVRDQAERFLPKSELRDEEGYEGPLPVTARSDRVRPRIFTFGPLAEGESYSFEEMPNGLIAVVVTTAAADYPGTIPPGAAGTQDVAKFVASGRGSTARKLASLNSIHRAHFKR